MKKNIITLFLAAGLLMIGGCETFDLDQTENPSTLEQERLDPVYAFNYVQLTLPDFVNSANSFSQRVTRQMAMTGGNTYDNAFAGVNFNDNWTTGYSILNTIKTMEPKAQQNGQNFILGASKVIRCYVLMTLVDMYGDIPYSEALQGTANLRPRYDRSADVYAGVYDELNEAIQILQTPNASDDEALTARDLYYGGEEGTESPTKWITVAKSLKLKMLNNARLVGSIGDHNVGTEAAALIAENDLIDSKDEDFEFKYGRNRVNPNSRHPLYNDQYEFGGGAYIANYFIWAVTQEKVSVDNAGNTTTIKDPREFYYFHKQGTASSSTSSQTLPCKDIARPSHFLLEEYDSFYSGRIVAPYCFVAGGYLGRDHGDDSGIPNDDELRAVAGLYPIGGIFKSSVSSTQHFGTDGALGEGIMPMLQSSYVHFIKAELYATTLADAGLARSEFQTGIESSIDKVQTFLPEYERDPSTLTQVASTATYVNFVMNYYDTVNSNLKLEMIEKEYYIAAWGNGIEPYNNYRRTGFPSNFQPTFEEAPGPFYSTAFYSDYSVNNNPNTPNSVRTRKVFWDTANLQLH